MLGVYHWPAEECGFSLFHNIIQAQEPIEICRRAAQAARAVDHLIYLPRLMEDFAERGGRLEVGGVLDGKVDIGCIAGAFRSRRRRNAFSRFP